MAIIPKNILSELVNSDGTRIGGNNVRLSRDNSKSASNSTTDPMYKIDGTQIRNSVVQSTRQQGYRGYYSLVPMPAVRTPTASVYTYMDNIDYMDDESDFTEDVNGIITSLSTELDTKIDLNDLQDFEEYMGYPYWQSKQEFETAFIDWWGNKTNVVESSKKKMKNMVEDIVDKTRKTEVVNGRFIFCGIMKEYFGYSLNL
jgi:hypothetical protein